VRLLRKRGMSLRAIAGELTLSLHTMVTITSKEAGTDRTTVKHLARIDPDRAAADHLVGN
jgi:orotate phosphoribosyltransferase-like protein